MFKKSTFILVTVLLLISLVGCNKVSSNNGASNQNTPASTSTDTSSEDNYQMLPYISGSKADVKLDASADGSTQQLKIGQIMSISLESNLSTGYSWFATTSDPQVIVQLGEAEYQQPSTPMPGAPEITTLFFQATKAGTATVTLDYKRGFEQGVKPEKTLTINIEVK